VGEVARLWNPRSRRRLRRYWVSFDDQIVIGGEGLEQSGVLSMRPACEGTLRARLQVMGRVFEEAVDTGNDVAVWINRLELYVGVKAIENARLLLEFGIPSGTSVNVTLEARARSQDDASAPVRGYRRRYENGAGCPIGLCQTAPFSRPDATSEMASR